MFIKHFSIFIALIAASSAGTCKFLFLFFPDLIEKFTEWKPYTGPSGPLADGISAGLNEFSKQSFVGRGTVQGQLAPAKLMIEATDVYGAGLYFEHSHIEHYLTTGIEYYAKEDDCNYKWVPSTGGEIVPNAIQFRSSPYTFYVGRTNSFNSIQVGKVTLEHHVMYYGYGGKGHSTPNYEVLVCNRVDGEMLKLNDKLDEILKVIFEIKAQLKCSNDNRF